MPNEDIFLTVFTPTYNRAGTLSRLHDSLIAQDSFGFEWLVVDDGSTDGSSDVVKKWMQDSPFPIRLFSQQNSGKHVAHNLGAREARGKLFLCVDSDDWLEPYAISTIRRDAPDSDEEGLLYPKLFSTKAALNHSSWFPPDTAKIELCDMRMKYGLVVETAIVFNTRSLIKHPFPVVKGERYMPEGAAYYDFHAPELFHVHDDCFYRCEYLQEGLTKNIWSNWYHNPVGTRFALSKRYDSACAHHSLRGLRERISAVVGAESLNLALGVNVFLGLSSSCHCIEKVICQPLSKVVSRKRYTPFRV